MRRRFLIARGALVVVASVLAGQPTTAQGVARPPSPRDIYVFAYRASARQWCRAGARDALGGALAGTRSVVNHSVAEPERAGVHEALDSTHAALVRDGGCAALGGRASVVIVDRFEGHGWNETKEAIAPRERAVQSDDGFSVVTRLVHLETRVRRTYAAYADYTFATEGGRLVRGRYRIPVDDGAVEEQWAAVETDIIRRYPVLHVARTDGTTVFTNPDTQALEVLMRKTRGPDGRPFIDVLYPGYSLR